MAAITLDITMKLYIATFKRAGDTAGIDYWMKDSKLTSIEDVAKSFFDQPESAIYKNKTNSELVSEVYKNVLGKEANSADIAYWAGELDAGHFVQGEVVLAIINGAINDDAIFITNQAAVANKYYEVKLNDKVFAEDILKGVTTDTKTVDAAKAKIDALFLVNLTDKDGDIISGTSASTVYVADSKTFQAKDSIIDQTTTDSDVLNVTLSSDGAAAHVSGVEAINYTIDNFIGGLAEFNAANVSGTKLTAAVIADKLDSFDGEAKINNIGTGVEIIAGAGVKTLTLDGDATDAVIDVTATENVTALTVTDSRTVKLKATGDATITYNDANPSGGTTTDTLIISGEKNVTIKATVADVTKDTITDSSTATTKVTLTGAAAALDVTKFSVDSIGLGADFGNVSGVITVANGQKIDVDVAQTGTLTIADANTTDTAYTTNLKAGVNFNALVVNDTSATTNLELTGNSTITTLTQGANALNVSGTGNLTIGSSTTELNSTSAIINTSALTGNATVYSAVVATAAPAAAATGTFVFGAGNDTLKHSASLNNVGAVGTTLTAVLGAGDDTVELTSIASHVDESASKLTINGGAGTDTLKIAGGLNLSDLATFSVDVENITMLGTTAKFSAAQLTGKAFTFNGTSATTDTLTVTSATDITADLSKITLSGVEKLDVTATAGTINITGSSGKNYINGAAGNDTITGGAETDNLYGGAGDDTITAGDGQDVVDGGAGNDKIDLTGDTKTENSKDIVVVSNTNKTDTIKGFVAGNGADLVQISATDTTMTTTSGAATFAESDKKSVANNTAFELGASIATNDVIELTNAVSSDNATLSATSTGADLLKTLSSSAGGTASEITVAAGSNAIDQAYLAVYQGTSAYLYHLTESATDSNKVVAAGITLVGAFEGVAAGAFDNSDFIVSNVITGTAGADILNGTVADDTIDGLAEADTITGGTGADTITGSAGADNINLTETTAAIDTVVFSGATDALNGSDTITGFTLANDVLKFSSLTSGALANTITSGTMATAADLATENTSISLASNKVFVAQVANAAAIDSAADIVTAVTDTGVMDALDVAASATAFLVVSGDDNTTTAYVYGITNDGTATIAAGEVVLVGTITVDSNEFTSANFAF